MPSHSTSSKTWASTFSAPIRFSFVFKVVPLVPKPSNLMCLPRVLSVNEKRTQKVRESIFCVFWLGCSKYHPALCDFSRAYKAAQMGFACRCSNSCPQQNCPGSLVLQ